MKKVLVFILAALFAISCILLVACNGSIVELKIDGAPETVTRGDTIDYSKIKLIVTMDDGTTQTLALTDKDAGVNYTPIDTTTTGPKTLSARYRGKSAQATITVVEGNVEIDSVIVTEFNNTDGYNAYLEAKAVQSNKETEFYNREENYKVGTANGYKFLPKVTVLDDGGDEVALPESQVKTTYVLYTVDNGVNTKVENVETYLSNVENNIYYFKSQAEGVTFKLEVSLEEGFELIDEEMATTVSQVFTVVDGYNVYDALGLSVLDNLNNKSWAGLKSHKYAWDNGKALSEFTDVKQVILHNDIEITSEFLPDNYFWKVGEGAPFGGKSYNEALSVVPENLKEYLPGSLKEINLDESYSQSTQRGLYVSDGIGLSGNYLKISYEANYNKKGEKGIYVVYDSNQKGDRDYPEGHWSVMAYKQEGEADLSATIENVYFVGETGKTENNNLPTGLMMLSTHIGDTTLDNVIGTNWFCNIVADSDQGVTNINDSKMYNSFSQMVYSWHSKEINITHSEMKRAGGPILIVEMSTSSTAVNTVINIDSTDNMESTLTGAEMWFTINNLPETDVQKLFAAATLSDSVAGTHYMDGGKVNLIAVVIPAPGDVFTNQDAIKGTINVGEYQYGMEEALYSAVVNVSATAAAGATVAETTATELKGQLGEYESAIPVLQKGFEDLSEATAMLPYAPMYKCGNSFGFAAGSDIEHLQFSSLQAVYEGITVAPDGAPMSLYGGVQLVISTLEGKIAELSQAGEAYAQMVEQLTQLKASWEAVKAGLDPIATMQFDAETWAHSWTAGQLACWINPAAMGESGNKPFMIMLGEKATVAAQ